MTSEQKTLIRFDPPDPGFAVVNDRVSFTTEGSERVVSVHGIIFAHFDIKDRPAAAYAMVSLMMNRVSSYLERKIIGLGVDIRLGREFNETCIAEESPDAVVVAAEDRESGTLLSDIGNGYRIAKKI